MLLPPKLTSNKSKPTSSSSFPSDSQHNSSPTNPSPPATIYRQLCFDASLPLQITLASAELPPHADRSVENYYIQASRVTYLPLLLPQVRKYLLELVLDESTAASVTDDDLWFDHQGVALRWHWPIGLLYDYHTSHTNLLPSSSSSSSTSSAPQSLASYFAPPPNSQATIKAKSNPFAAAGSSAWNGGPLPFKLTLHIKSPPTESLLLGPSLDGCKSCFMNMIKEADFVRWGNGKRVTNMRKEQQDNLWEGIIQNDFEKYWNVASKLVPLPSSTTSSPSNTRSPTPLSNHSNANSNSTGPTDGRLPEANGMRSVPMRIYLPEGAPVLQDVVPPLQDGIPTTLKTHLTTVLPLFFPLNKSPLARPLLHGVILPLETEVGWLGACMPGADGWVSIVLVLEAR